MSVFVVLWNIVIGCNLREISKSVLVCYVEFIVYSIFPWIVICVFYDTYVIDYGDFSV